MASLSIHDLPPDVHAELRARAERHGRTLEAEALDILTQACHADAEHLAVDALQAWVDRLYPAGKPAGVADALVAERRETARHE